MRLELFLIVCFLTSCQNRTQSTQKESTPAEPADSTQTITSEPAILETAEVDQEKKRKISDSTISPLGLSTLRDFELNGNNRSKKSNDSIFAAFLIEFTTYQNSANDILYDHPQYDVWNTLAYTETDELSPEVVSFEDSVKQIGFVVAASEGNIYLDKDPDFLTRFSPYLSQRMNLFLTEYKKDIIYPFAEDNSIIVSTDEHIRRLMFWEKFSKQHPDFELPDYAKNEFRYLLFFFMLGTGNSAIHDWGDPPKVRIEVIESYKRVVQEYPNSTAAEYLTDYLNFLEQKNFIWDRSFDTEYGREKFPDMYGG